MSLSRRRRLLMSEVVLLSLFIVLLVTMRRGALAMAPVVIASTALLLLVVVLTHLTFVIRERRYAAALLLAGVAMIFGGGLSNWLFSLQGYVILTESDAIPLASTSHLQALEAGLLSRPDELAGMLQLEKLEFRPAGDGFQPVSRIRLLQGGGDGSEVTLTPTQSATRGALRLHQGAFGFSPRIVITHAGRAVFDQVVPFTTRSPMPGAVAFEGDWTVKAHDLALHGAINIASLDAEKLRGHPQLGLIIRKGAVELGRGQLLLGHFAELSEGYRVGFLGLKRWSEIDISRRSYPEPIIAGFALLMTGAVWQVAARYRR